MPKFLFGFVIASVAGAAIVGSLSYLPAFIADLSQSEAGTPARVEHQKTKEELIAEALEKSSKIKGLYMTDSIANYALKRRSELVRLAENTKINAFVIDVKEVCGPEYDEKRLKEFLADLKSKNIWPIARIVTIKDASQRKAHPEWYLTRKTPKAPAEYECAKKENLVVRGPEPQVNFWRDKKGGYWLDPAHPEVRQYLLDFGKKMIDLGFSELQFDYIRFPSDGITKNDVFNAIYPAWDGKISKCAAMKGLFEFLSKGLREYKPDIILSADLFGYAAVGLDTGIGQCLEDLGDNFDYISFMLYGSHYYNGFAQKVYPARNLPAINFTASQARANPDVVVERSLIFARDFFDGLIGLPKATSTIIATTTNPMPRSRARLRPWLEDFFHDQDKASGRPYGETKVRMQIDAAERATPYGWLLWNAANIYTEAALDKK
ncbi:MAG: hypothetical protein HYW91_02355 [Candidatus Sungbacteria bacterium]|nr:hypothetical protein [Candidatus Sungbacteria bacterium]